MTYKINKSANYNGSGLAFAGVEEGEVKQLVYLEDIPTLAQNPQLAALEAQGHYFRLLPLLLEDKNAKRQATLLQDTYGEVVFGMCSCWEFTPL